MAAVITDNGYRVTISQFGTNYRVEYHREDETIASFRWCDNGNAVMELLTELGVVI